MKKRNGIKKRLLSLMLTAAMMAGGVPNPANLVLADELNNKITIEANTETEASTKTEAAAESEIQSETEAVSQEETVTEDVSETDAVEGTTKETTEEETTEEETIEESENVSETEIHTETETQTVEETVEASTEETENGWDGVTTENIYEAENYKVTYTLSSHWNTGYNANIKIENTSDTAIENWYLSFGYDSEIINIWNAQIHEKTQNGYIIKNAGLNFAGTFIDATDVVKTGGIIGKIVTIQQAYAFTADAVRKRE